MADPCVCCGKDTSFGSGNFVNRVPGDYHDEATGEFREGYWCAECIAIDCNGCDKSIYEEDEIWVELPDGERFVYHDGCVPEHHVAYIEEPI